ncbi:MAG: DUF983 domain-containing protein [Caulobacteraceae bacterium]|nr:DUF983 domain-containing protein [Caulobacteraceae bacterium]
MSSSQRSVLDGLKRGLRRRCPNCGEGRLFAGYLKVDPTCARCGHDNSRYRADDGPAYVTVLLAGHLLVAPMLVFPVIWEADPMLVAPLAMAGVGAVTLAGLAFIKGGWIGLMWANGSDRTQQ